jgi:hypothetical protein
MIIWVIIICRLSGDTEASLIFIDLSRYFSDWVKNLRGVLTAAVASFEAWNIQLL